MNLKIARACAVALACVALGLSGCSQVEPPHGTRVVFSMPGTTNAGREKINELCIYLLKRSHQLLGVKAPRVESVQKSSLVLLLPGSRISRRDAERLVRTSSIELYHLANVATKNAPNRPWKIKPPATAGGAYLFLGPDAERIDSLADSRDVLADVVGTPAQKPIVTGKDIKPNASLTDVRSGWAVLVQFDAKGAQAFYDFTEANRGEYLAVFYNGRLISAPVVKNAIRGGQAFITGFKSHDEAQTAIDQINSGRLPVKIKLRSVTRY